MKSLLSFPISLFLCAGCFQAQAAQEIRLEEPADTEFVDDATSAFGATAMGTTLVKTFTIRNVGDAPLTGLALSKTGSNTFDFLTSTLTSTTLAAGASQTFTITFSPQVAGSRSATVRLASNDANENPYDIRCTGTGTAAAFRARGNGVDIANNDTTPSLTDHTDFGNVEQGQGGTRTFTIRNTGLAPLNLTGTPLVAVSGTAAADFTITMLPSTPVAASGGETTFEVTFLPNLRGLRSATLEIASNDSLQPPVYRFGVQGTGTGPEIALQNPAATEVPDGGDAQLGGHLAGGATVSQTWTILNSGTSPLTGLAVALSGPQAADFGVTAPAAVSLAPGGSTTFTVSFTPGAQGTRRATLQVSSNDLDEAVYDISLRASVNQVAFPTYLEARNLLGQAAWNTRETAILQRLAGNPAAVAVSATGQVAVVDEAFHRVTLWNQTPVTLSPSPDVLVGQTSWTVATSGNANDKFFTPTGASFTPDGGKLLVADPGNNRVVIFNTVPTTHGATADVIIGGGAGTSATSLRSPRSVQVAADGRMVIADSGSHRVLIYNSVPVASGAAANVVVGQSTFTNGGSTLVSPTTLSNPSHAMITADNKLIVTDRGNNRVLIWNTVPVTNGTAPDVVIGQPNLTSGGTTTLNGPTGVAVSSTGQLAVSDTGKNRVLIYHTIPVSHGTAADAALGQPNLTSSLADNDPVAPGISARSMNQPTVPFFTSDGRLWVPGRTMRRVMVFGGAHPADYRITSEGGVLTITDLRGAADVLQFTEASPGQWQLLATDRRIAVGDAPGVVGSSGLLPLSGITSIVLNSGAGSDSITMGGSAQAGFPSLTIHGGAGNDTLTFTGDLTFAANASLDLDLSNDHAAPGIDSVTWNAAWHRLSGSGAALVRTTGPILFSGSGLSVVDGLLTMEANLQTPPSAMSADGIRLFQSSVSSSGAGQVTVKGRGGNDPGRGGVALHDGSLISGGLTGTIFVEGWGGSGDSSGNTGVSLTGLLDSPSLISSLGADVVVHGTGGGPTGSTGNDGIYMSYGEIAAAGTGMVTVEGSSPRGAGVVGHLSSPGGAITITGSGLYGVLASASQMGSGALTITGTSTGSGDGIGFAGRGVCLFGNISAHGGPITITGTGSDGPGGRHVGIDIEGGSVTNTGNGSITLTGTGGTSPGASNMGIYMFDGGRLTAESGDISLNGTSGIGTGVGTYQNSGIYLFHSEITTTGSGNVSIIGNTITPTGYTDPGIYVDLPITSGGSISLTGSSYRAQGIVGQDVILAATTGVFLTGTAGTGTGVNGNPNAAILLNNFQNPPGTITTASGPIVLTGIVPLPAVQIALRMSVPLGGPGYAGPIEIEGDSLWLYGSPGITTQGAVTLRPHTPGTTIQLGGSEFQHSENGTGLVLSDGDLDKIDAPVLVIGSPDSGAIGTPYPVTRSSPTDIILTSGADISTSPGTIATGGGSPTSYAFGSQPVAPLLLSYRLNPTAQNRISFSTQPGQIYRVMSSTTLAPGSWSTENTIHANASTATWIAPASTAPRQFFQIVKP